MKGSDTMTEFVLQSMLNIPLNFTLSALALLTFLFNYAVLKLKTEYRGFKYQIILVLLLCPYFNAIFFLFNCLLATTTIEGYKVIKVKRKGKARAHIQAKA